MFAIMEAGIKKTKWNNFGKKEGKLLEKQKIVLPLSCSILMYR